ncbi:MAG: sulfite exporter TauE/SafE family protein [Deltaproteobacteria bacterium]|nr:sulfite exporter TauE/SafE family protein [Deltaproteobacteria bacterium]
MELGVVLLLIGGGFAAGVVNTLAGGGSLLTVPLLHLAGLPGGLANGTNRVGVMVQNLVATWGFGREGVPSLRPALPLLLPLASGALLGAAVISRIPDHAFEQLFGAAMLLLLIPTLRPPPAANSARRKMPGWLRSLCLFTMGIYGGALQAGTGLLIVHFLHWSGASLLQSNAIKVALNFCFTLLVLPIFLFAGQISWPEAAVLTIGFALGGAIGPRLAIRASERTLRTLLALATLALAGRMLGLY